VIPMTRDTVLAASTVVVRDGRIAAIGPSRTVKVPSGARRIDGRGKYLIPGLADMHTHLFSDDTVPDSVAADELGVMLANGVTAIRLMIGTPEHLLLQRDIIAGRTLGPQLWIASPQFAGKQYDNGVVVTTPDQARAAVRKAKADGYDFVKLTLFISRPVYDAITDEARRAGIRVVGHVDDSVGVARAIAAGQQIEHLDNYFESALVDSARMKGSVTQYGVFKPENWKSLDYIDDRKLDALAGATARAGIWSSPTLNIFNQAFAIGTSDAEMRARPDWYLMPAEWRAGYLGARTKYWSTAASEGRRKRYVEIRNHLVKAIADSGGKIMAGSDTPEWFHVYGWGLHREIASYVGAGLTPYQALETATRNPAEFLGALDQWGTIEKGKRADFVLLAANPLEQITNSGRIEAVSIGGRWLARAELTAMIRRATERLGGAPPDSLR
ncbi:MAG TPA: amidohydrolase family protein, partial [Gemmatimonadales bacterium]|nr:amidohydrolase family protein [Gemmatimonadales bacterium]